MISGRSAHNLHRIGDDAPLGIGVLAMLGKDIIAAAQFDKLAHPADTSDDGVVPFLEVHARTVAALLSTLSVPLQSRNELLDVAFGFWELSHQRSKPHNHAQNPLDRAMVEANHLESFPNKLFNNRRLKVRPGKDNIRLESADFFDVCIQIGAYLRFRLPCLGRPHSEP